jgi:hypothetical protein
LTRPISSSRGRCRCAAHIVGEPVVWGAD